MRLPDERGYDLGTEQAHAEDVESLPIHVDLAHVHDAFEPEQRGGGGRGHAVLARTRLGDQAGLAHALSQQGLTQDVVDLVRTGVVQVLPLQQHPHPELLGEPGALGER